MYVVIYESNSKEVFPKNAVTLRNLDISSQ